MEQIKPNLVNIYLKTAALPPIKAYFDISKKSKNPTSLNGKKSRRAV